MANLSQQKRQRMLTFLDTIRQEHKDDDAVLMALGEIESELNAKKYGLVWERHEEAVDVMMRDNIPVFTECAEREISAAPGEGYNFILEGDNLHSLRLLEKTHAGKVDFIYIEIIIPKWIRDKEQHQAQKLLNTHKTRAFEVSGRLQKPLFVSLYTA